MTREVVCQHVCDSRSQKPTLLETSPWGVICAVLVLSCGTSPIDAVVADQGVNDAPGDTPASDGCAIPSAGRFILSLGEACLRRGDATTVFGNPAFMTELSADCTTTRAQWDLTPAVAGTFTLRNVEDQLSLDVRAFSDVPGTPIIVYEPNTLDNQRFWLRPRTTDSYELAPRHAPTLCAQGRTTAVEIWPCEATNANQVFHLARVACL